MKPQVITFHCVLKNHMGQVLSASYNGEVITDDRKKVGHLHGLVKGLVGLKPGERREIFVPADEAYGFYNKELVIDVPSDDFPDGDMPKLGSEILGEFQDGAPRIFRVIQVTRAFVTLDGNHPLAGQDLIFDIEATEVREATADDANTDKITFSPVGYLH